MQKQIKDEYKTSRFLYIFEATFEYFISMLVGGAYLAKVTSAIGINDTLTGILTSFVSLGWGFQLVAIFLANKHPVKNWVTLLHGINHLAFALIYFVPFFKIHKTIKILLFITFLLVGYILGNIVRSPKINWFMSLVDDNKRGSFTANKEMVSLIGGMFFSFVMGLAIDHFEEIGNPNGAFILLAISVLVFMVLHSCTLIFSKEKPYEEKEKVSVTQNLKELITNKTIIKVILISVFWNVAHYVATPFYGTYQIKELGFSMTFVSVLSACYAIVRTLFSKPMGKYADKTSFAKMLNVCFTIVLVAFAINTFTVPSNGKVFYTIYYILYAIAMAGINSSAINLIFDYVDHDKRMSALALNSALSGCAGFITTLLVSPIVSYIQNNGNKFLGINVYAQQAMSALAVVLTALLLLYLNTVIKNITSKKDVQK